MYLNNFCNIFLKFITVESAPLKTISICIDSIKGQAESLRKTSAVGYAKTHKRGNTQFGTETVAGQEAELLVGLQQSVKTDKEVRKVRKKCGVEHLKVFVVLFLDIFTRLNFRKKVFYLTGLKLSCYMQIIVIQHLERDKSERDYTLVSKL